MLNRLTYLFLLLLMLASCGDYQKVLKSRDPEYKYQRAKDYFAANDFVRAQTLFEDVASYYKGTDRGEEMLNYLARCCVGQQKYTDGGEYYEAYLRNYPKGKFAIESRYMVGHCYYMDSPDARLDQTVTDKAIESLVAFLEMYPESDYAQEAYKELNEMYDKKAYKELLNARLYYNLGTYLGNNYAAAIVVCENALKRYPGNAYLEEFAFIGLQSRYQEILNSTEEKKVERARDLSDECYNFQIEYPNSKRLKSVDKINREVDKIIVKQGI